MLIASLFFIATSLAFVPTAESQEQELVRVRLKSQQDEIFVSGYGLRVQGHDSNFQKIAIPRNENIRIRRFAKEGKSFWLVTRNTRSQIISDPILAIDGQGLMSQAQSLPPQILLSSSGKNKMDLIGVLPLNEYLTGVIASEMPLNWPMETLKAQAVAARSYTLAVIKERRRKAFHLESSVLDQVFRHVVMNDDDNLIRKAARAVQETQNMRIVGSNGQVLKAFYHSDCGGKTVSAKNVWNMNVGGGEAIDESCPTNPKAHWHLSVAKEVLYAKIRKLFALEKSQIQIQGLQFIPIAQEERIKEVRVAFNDGQTRAINGNDFRGLIGFQDLKSNLFTVQETDKDLAFTGRGFGHGVGLCQWGSRAMGLQGKKFTEILKHYYPQAQLVSKN